MRNFLKQYFGTDGIRGRVGSFPITPDFILKLAWAMGSVLSKKGNGKVLIGKDTRISGYMFESALEAGLSAAGVDTLLLGPMPTPAIAYLTRTLRADAGIVISASHNPFYDNGIKIFSSTGMKLSDELELEIESFISESMSTVDSARLGRAARIVDASGRYIEFCKSTVPSEMTLNGLRMVVDCANGAAYHIAANVFRELGAQVIELGVEPNGLNINLNCGATHPDQAVRAVIEHQAHLGIALDGDGDRVVMIDEKGRILDGDDILYVIAKHRKFKQNWSGGVVGTVMSNMGFERALSNMSIPFVRVPVGDRHVINELKNRGWMLGGEPSGHVVCMEKIPTGDGIIAGLQVLVAMVETRLTLSELTTGLEKSPQVLRNVSSANQNALHDARFQLELSEVQKKIESQKGRVLVRRSGTESLLRIMVEGLNPEEVNWAADHLVSVLSGLS